MSEFKTCGVSLKIHLKGLML